MVRPKASLPPVHWRHLGDAAIWSKDHAERNVHWGHVDVGATGAPAVTVVQLHLQALRGLRFGQSNPIDPVGPIPVPAEAHRGDTVTDSMVVAN